MRKKEKILDVSIWNLANVFYLRLNLLREECFFFSPSRNRSVAACNISAFQVIQNKKNKRHFILYKSDCRTNQNLIVKLKIKKACELEFAHCSLINFTYPKCKVILFIKHFLISPVSYEEITLINLGFLIKGDFWYVVFMLEFIGLNVCITFIRIWKFRSTKKIP